MADSKNPYGKNFREAVASIRKLPATERSAVSNRQAGPLPRPTSTSPKRGA
jgi:hypothetical protein